MGVCVFRTPVPAQRGGTSVLERGTPGASQERGELASPTSRLRPRYCEVMQDAEASSAVAATSAAAPSRSHTRCMCLDWDSSSGEDGTHQISKPNSQCQSTLGCRAFPPPPPPPDRSVPTTPVVSLPPSFQSPPASDADCNLAGFRAVDCTVWLRVDDAFACCREDDSVWFDAWPRPAILSDEQA